MFCLQQISSLLSNITAASAVNFLIIHGTADGECDSLYRYRRWSRDVPPLFTDSVTFHASEKFLSLFYWKLTRLHTEVPRGRSGLLCSCEVWYKGFLCPDVGFTRMIILSLFLLKLVFCLTWNFLLRILFTLFQRWQIFFFLHNLFLHSFTFFFPAKKEKMFSLSFFFHLVSNIYI